MLDRPQTRARLRCGCRLLVQINLVLLTFASTPATPAAGADSAVSTPKAHSRELVSDPHFQQGFVLLDPAPGKKVPYGKLQPAGYSKSPAWEMAQWSSKFRLDPGPATPGTNHTVEWRNPAKSVLLSPPGQSESDLTLAVNASVEYGDRARAQGEPWVHLLVEQAFTNPPALAQLTEVRLHLEARLLRSHRKSTPEQNPALHAAQFQVFFTVQNLRPNSKGRGRFLWFGVPLYDSRYRLPLEHKSRDTAGSDMFIFTPGGETYTSQSAWDGHWITIDKDLLPLMREALDTAWQRGFLTESKDPADYHITGLNLGWEVPGIYDVAMQVRNLSLRVTQHGSQKP